MSDSTVFVAVHEERLSRLKVIAMEICLHVRDTAQDLRVRLMVCVHVKQGCHCGSVATLQRLKATQVTGFIRQCVYTEFHLKRGWMGMPPNVPEATPPPPVYLVGDLRWAWHVQEYLVLSSFVLKAPCKGDCHIPPGLL